MMAARILLRSTVLLVALSLCALACSDEDDEPEQPTDPDGEVLSCHGACPLGECTTVAGPLAACSTLYPEPVNDKSVYCNPASSGSYCLVTTNEGDLDDYWVVTCQGDAASFDYCEEHSCTFGVAHADCAE
jgi:hypothetical protein